jgi:ADP-ribose pyrophosphatase YjhB (NUDIX family)
MLALQSMTYVYTGIRVRVSILPAGVEIMTQMVPIAITILKQGDKFLFLKRRNPPYENLWSLVGGKVNVGEHIPSAAVREVMEETGTEDLQNYRLKGVVSERLVGIQGALVSHFLIFVGMASISSHIDQHREGTLALYSSEEVQSLKESILPSDYEMFTRFVAVESESLAYHEAELIQHEGMYTLRYYREVIT